MIESLLTKRAQEALHRYIHAGPVMVNMKKDGFDQFRASDALALIIAGVAVVEEGTLRLTNVGSMLTDDFVGGNNDESTYAMAAVGKPGNHRSEGGGNAVMVHEVPR